MDILEKPASLGVGGMGGGQEINLSILNDFHFDFVSVIIFLSYARAENICKSSVLKNEIGRGRGGLFLSFQFLILWLDNFMQDFDLV